jgi:Na+/H+ antiporter NhaD/arsenite permease-like protein
VTSETLGLVIVVLTLGGIAAGSLPIVRMDRATMAIVGATTLVLVGTIPLSDAYAAIDLNTIVLLFGMMVLNANLRLAGFFDIVARRLAHHAHTPAVLLVVTVLTAGVLSAIFLNDTIVLVFTPLLLEVTRVAGLNPLPFLMAAATAANVGSVATLVGNPQNMLIGVASGIGFNRFLVTLAPVALGGLLVVTVVLLAIYRAALTPRAVAVDPAPARRVHGPLLRKSIVASLLLIIALVAGMPVPLAALGAASVLLVTRRIKPARVFREIDWSLLVFFSGLFVVTAAAERLGVTEAVFGWLLRAGTSVAELSAVAAVVSNLVSNVPAVLLLRPVVEGLARPEIGWLTLAMATTLAGNLTLLGSVANLIVAESAGRAGVRLSFGEYLKAGVPITLLTLGWGILLLSFTA